MDIGYNYKVWAMNEYLTHPQNVLKKTGNLNMSDDLVDELREEARWGKKVCGQAADHIEQLEQSFDLRWSADMRAIKRWRKDHPGKELTLPDHADLCVWLLERIEKLESENNDISIHLEGAMARIEKLEAALRRWDSYGCPDCGGDCGSANPPVACCIMIETRKALEGKDD